MIPLPRRRGQQADHTGGYKILRALMQNYPTMIDGTLAEAQLARAEKRQGTRETAIEIE